LRLNTSTHYAIRMMQYLVEQNKIVSATELAGNINISPRYSMQIIAKLRDGGLLGPIIGMGGGYKLLKTPESISVYDVVMLMEGIGAEEALDSIDTKSELYGIIVLLPEYANAYLQSITFDKFVGRDTIEWQAEFAGMVKLQIAELKRHQKNHERL